MVLYNGLVSADNIAVFEIIHRDANDIKERIKNFLSKDAIMSVDQNKLIIQSDAENLANIKKVIASLDVAKKQLKIMVYWGNNPEAMADSTILSTNTQESNKVQILTVEDGEMVSLTENSIMKLTTAVSGEQQQFQHKEYSDVDSTVVADLAGNIAKAKMDIDKISKEIIDLEQQIIAAKKLVPVPPSLQALNAQLNNKKTALYNNKKNLADFEAKQESLATSADRIKKQNDYDGTNGAIAQDFITLPEGIYIKPKVLNDQQLRVEINIIKAAGAAKKAFSAETKAVTQQIKTTLKTTANKWQKISGQDDISSTINPIEQITTYSTASNNSDKKVWLKIEVVD